MKRLWASLFLLAAILGACIGSAATVSNFVDEVAALLEQAAQAAQRGDFTAAAELCEAVSDIMESRAIMLGALLRHSESDQVESGVRQLVAFARSEELPEFLALCAKTIHDIFHLRDMELPMLHNIL